MSLRTVRASHAVRAAARAGDAGLGRVPIAAPAARVQARNGGAVYVAQGTLVFVGVAISDTRTYVRPLGLAHGRPQWQGSGPWRTGAVCAALRRRSVRG